MDPALDLEARRLFVSTALSYHAARCLGGHVPRASDAKDLLALARRLGEEAASLERRHRLHFDPPYPGVTAGVEAVGSAVRLVLACAVLEGDAPEGDAPEGDAPFGTVFTTLIAGRRPQASVAPPEARIPEEWRAPDGMQ